jgi:hypothetical protein
LWVLDINELVKGKIYRKTLWFPVDVPLNQSIDRMIKHGFLQIFNPIDSVKPDDIPFSHHKEVQEGW